jgi:predicted ArsR family transcriptional regulator
MGEPDAGRTIRITDPRALRALAHPGRNRILEQLQLYGPATATECAEAAGMSPSGCSYHLRMLARYGFVEETRDETRADGRERLWRAVIHGWTADVSDAEDQGEAQAVDMALSRVLLESSDQKVIAWADRSHQEPREWRDAALVSNSTIVATAEELQEIQHRLQAVLAPYLLRRHQRADQHPGRLPDGARLVHAAIRLAPEVSPHRDTPHPD